MGRLPWIIWADTKCHLKGPRGRGRGRIVQRRGNVTLTPGAAVLALRRGTRSHAGKAAGKGGEPILPYSLWRDRGPADTLILAT